MARRLDDIQRPQESQKDRVSGALDRGGSSRQHSPLVLFVSFRGPSTSLRQVKMEWANRIHANMATNGAGAPERRLRPSSEAARRSQITRARLGARQPFCTNQPCGVATTGQPEKFASMKKILLELVRFLIAVAILAGAYAVFRKMGTGEAPTLRATDEERAKIVETFVVQAHESGLDIEVNGVAAPYREIPVAAEVAGRIVRKSPNCRAGRYVEQGEELILLDDADYVLEVARLNKEIEQAVGNLKELDVEKDNVKKLLLLSEEDLEIQRREVNRLVSLQQKKAASVADVDQAQRVRIAAENGLTQLRNQLRLHNSRQVRLEAAEALKQVQLERAKLDLERTRVRAPISGVIVVSPAEEDAFVQRGSPLMTVEDTSRVEVRCQLKMEELYWLWGLTNRQASASTESNPGLPRRDYEIPQAPVTVVYELGDQQYRWRGQLSRFEGIGLDERTRTMPCRVLVHDPTKVQMPKGQVAVAPPTLVRGMFVKVQIHVAAEEPLLRIPEFSIRPGESVWVFDSGKLRVVPVSIVRIAKGFAVVRKSQMLVAGARVVISPLVAPRNGMPIREVGLDLELDEPRPFVPVEGDEK